MNSETKNIADWGIRWKTNWIPGDIQGFAVAIEAWR